MTESVNPLLNASGLIDYASVRPEHVAGVSGAVTRASVSSRFFESVSTAGATCSGRTEA